MIAVETPVRKKRARRPARRSVPAFGSRPTTCGCQPPPLTIFTGAVFQRMEGPQQTSAAAWPSWNGWRARPIGVPRFCQVSPWSSDRAAPIRGKWRSGRPYSSAGRSWSSNP
jgi:hypothetical protein